MVMRYLRLGATAPLYLGPLLAGMAGFGWGLVPVFSFIFIVWVILRHEDTIPGAWRSWLQLGPVLRFAARLSVQVLVIALCLGIGRGLGGVADALPSFPIMLPVAVSFLALPLTRFVDPPAKSA